MTFLKRGSGDATLVGEGGGFQPSGLIGQWSSGILWSFWTETDPGNLIADGMAPVTYRKMGRGFRVYYQTQVEAKNAAKAAGVEINPQQVWRVECPKTSILNVPDKDLGNFADLVSFEVEISTEKSKKLRHKLHLISLPKSVEAYAKLNGWEVPTINLGDLTQRVLDAEGKETDPFNDELFKALCGDPEGVKLDWGCGLGKQRAALWTALGEPNPAKWHSKYNYDAQGNRAGTVEGDGLATVSDKLDEALGLIIAPWQAWGRIVSVKDPKPDATYEKAGEGKRLTIPVVWEFFADEKTAHKVAEEELRAREERAAAKAGVAATATVSQSTPSIPAVWVGQTPKDVVDTLKEFYTKLDGSKPLPLRKKSLKENMMFDTMDELDAWLDFAGLEVK